jgi:VIT1/CCC1 family predicted Fe2+/Mn2+ transporter
MSKNPVKAFISYYLTPSERLSEALYSLILVLTVISAIEISLPRDQQTPSILLFAALGTSVAWGMVDAVVYVLTGLHERNHHVRVVARVKKRPKKDAIRQIEDELEDGLIGVLDTEERDRIAEQVYATMYNSTPKRQDDVFGGVASFMISFLVVLPPVMPFVLNLPLDYAIRLSNVIAVAMLFIVGYVSGGLGGMNRIRWALTITVLGVIIVLVTILLGG